MRALKLWEIVLDGVVANATRFEIVMDNVCALVNMTLEKPGEGIFSRSPTSNTFHPIRA
jgi:hypothetical protein